MSVGSFGKIIFFMGPTGTGKSHLSFDLGQEYSSAIVNMDSVQIFRGLDIGSAKPKAEIRNTLPHFLFDIRNPDESFTAGDYRREALQVIDSHLQNQHLFFVGGSGFYQQALEKGMYDVTAVADDVKQALMQRLEVEGSVMLYEELLHKDPQYASKISPQDSYRVVRALSLMQSQGQSMTEIQKSFAEKSRSNFPYEFKKVALSMERDQLRLRLAERAEEMLREGLIEETEILINKGFSTSGPLQSVGYKEVQDFLQGRISKASLPEQILNSSMRLAKRQMTWLRRDENVVWFDAKTGLAQLQSMVRDYLAI